MKNKNDYTTKLTAIVNHFCVEIEPELLSWMDSSERMGYKGQYKTPFDKLDIIDGIENIEFNGHFGPYVFYSCDAAKSTKINKQVISLIKLFKRQMIRSKKCKK